MIEPDWQAIAKLQNAAMKKVYFVVGDDIDAIYHSGGGMNEYGAALLMYKEAVELMTSELPTNYIKFCAEETSVLFPSNGALALDQLQALIDDNYRKEAQIVELERKIVYILNI